MVARNVACLGSPSRRPRSRSRRLPTRSSSPSGAEERCPGGGELERERQLVETVAELADRVVDIELDAGGARPLDEEGLALVRGERRNGPACLATDLEPLAAGDEEPESRAGSQQGGEVVRKLRQEVLSVVQE